MAREGNNKKLIKFIFDTETTALAKGDQTEVYFDNHNVPKKTEPRGSIPQVIQIAGDFVGDTQDLAGDFKRSQNIHSPLILLDEAGTQLDPYNNIKIEFEYDSGSGQKEILHNEQIASLMESELEPNSPDYLLRKKITQRHGEFRISPESSEGLRALMEHSSGYYLSPGSMPISTAVTGSTMNKILASNVFEAKYGKPENSMESSKAISHILTKLSDVSKNSNNVVVQSGWNVTFDMLVQAQWLDLAGSEEEKRKWIEVYGDRINSNSSSVKVVDELDKLKNLHFYLMVEREEYSAVNFNKKKAVETLRSGESGASIVMDNVRQSLLSNEQGNYLKKNSAMNRLAHYVRTQKGQEKPLSYLKGVFSGALEEKYGLTVKGTDQEIVVDTAAKLVKELAESDYSNPGSTGGSMEIIRKHANELRRIQNAPSMLKAMFGITDGSSLLGVSRASKIQHKADDTLTISALKFMDSQATGMDLVFGHTLGSGQGGLLNAFVMAKDSYGETIRESNPSSQLKNLFNDVETHLRPIVGQGGLHDASIDVKNTGTLIHEIFEKHLVEELAPDTQDYLIKVMHQNIIFSAEGNLEKVVFAKDIEENILRDANFIEDSAPPGASQVDIARTTQNVGDTIGDTTRTTMGGMPSGIKTKAGVLAGAAFTLAGLALLGNNNSDIKVPGSKHNTIEGVSPSGDPLLHSFGSGNDPFSNQALNNIKYNFNLGSETLRSSMLGYKGDRLYDMLLGKDTFIDHTRSAERGNIIHSILEQEYISKGLAQSREHYVYSSELDVVGHIDLVLNSGIPLEIKSVEDFEALKNLTEPRQKHVSQANFYAYALDQPYALIGYAARNDPTKVKYFKVNTNVKRVMDDVAAIRSASASLKREGHDVVTYSAHKYMSDLYLQTTQAKYSRNAIGVAYSVGEGMMQGPADYSGHSAIKGLGDYGKHQKALTWRKENRTNLTNTSKYKGKSKIRNQGKHADLHANGALKYNARNSGYHNKSRQFKYSEV